ncbi:unnamed protein product [Vitrella brassicaformis CCMP3155]|uniref:UBX domain-containing protein n=1 Tax=Vitrella brassicaformis (strain CCMP3155) TaxID=1169540 RepID=A0A0G4EPT1_VITBC|nr:unnamed protein product [Vitrella brassicaformis CCMP3155]|eukprot:CEL99839.1 unnamed protein product [Vitrella brassicaformis CCMP3155]
MLDGATHGRRACGHGDGNGERESEMIPFDELTKGQLVELLKAHPSPDMRQVAENIMLVEKYAPQQLFTGGGHTLSEPSHAPPPHAPNTAKDHDYSPPIDTDKPTTKVTLRLHTGDQVKLTFNNAMPVKELYAAAAKASNIGVASFRLFSSAAFPPKPLDDHAQSLEEAGVMECLVTQKLK